MNCCPFCGNHLVWPHGFPYHWEHECPKNDCGSEPVEAE